jgi:hypothetical protein
MAREFWVTEENISDIHHASGAPPQNDSWTEKRFKIHVREIFPIDWEKIWKQVQDDYGLNVIYDDQRKSIKELVEKQIKGEE